MKLVLISSCAAILISMAVTGCTSKQAYNAGQAWQHNECNKIADQSERDRCISAANTSYEDYKRQIEGSKTK